MMLENRLSLSAARFFFPPETVTSARSPGTGAFVPRNPPSRARDVTHAPLRSAAERATGQTRAHRRISKGGGGCTKTKQPQQTLRQRSRSPRCSQILCWKPAPVVLVDRSFQKATFSPPPPLRSFLPLRGVSNLWREQRKGIFFYRKSRFAGGGV